MYIRLLYELSSVMQSQLEKDMYKIPVIHVYTCTYMSLSYLCGVQISWAKY